MKISINGEAHTLTGSTLNDALDEAGFGTAKVATALNGEFVPITLRSTKTLNDGDRIEVLAPMQGG